MTKLSKPKHILNPVQVDRVLQEAKKESFFDYVAFETMVTLNLKRSFLVGQTDPRLWRNPGLLIENLTPNGINILMKDGSKLFKPIPTELRAKINQIVVPGFRAGFSQGAPHGSGKECSTTLRKRTSTCASHRTHFWIFIEATETYC